MIVQIFLCKLRIAPQKTVDLASTLRSHTHIALLALSRFQQRAVRTRRAIGQADLGQWRLPRMTFRHIQYLQLSLRYGFAIEVSNQRAKAAAILKPL